MYSGLCKNFIKKFQKHFLINLMEEKIHRFPHTLETPINKRSFMKNHIQKSFQNFKENLFILNTIKNS